MILFLLDERQRKELAQYSPYIAIPKVSSQNRRYIPMDYLEGEIIPGDTFYNAVSHKLRVWNTNVQCSYGMDQSSMWSTKE